MKKTKSSSISVTLVPEKDLEKFSRHCDSKVMAALGFGRGALVSSSEDCLRMTVDLPQLGNEPLVEVWTSDLPHAVNRSGNISYASNPDLVIGLIECHEPQEGRLDQLTLQAYREILDFVNRMGFPFLVRFWNYFPNINQKTNGIERYKLFCAGRHDAFVEKYNSIYKHLSAGSAVGSRSGPLTIIFMAARNRDGMHFENPRQISAYRYPNCYGMRSPSFARATCKDWGGQKYLYVAGTASIVGYESRHAHSPLEQVKETHRNIEFLLSHCSALLNEGGKKIDFADAIVTKTYVRNEELYSLARDEMNRKMSGSQPGLYLVGDICREELLVEIEGIWLINSASCFQEEKELSLRESH